MDYKNGKIYTIRSHQTDKIYIGSTTQPLSKRLSYHKTQYKQYLNGKSNFVSSYDILQYEDAYIELLEEYPCENKLQLCKREGELIRGGNCVNKRIEGRTDKQYKEENKDKIKEYYQQNKDKLDENHKDYYEQNKDKILEYNKDYYQKNKDIILQRNKEKITCECGAYICQGEKTRHLKTQKHKKWLGNNLLSPKKKDT